jgi:Ran GTPase-activating protein (RanGAP) involved in mRNA processing and transport
MSSHANTPNILQVKLQRTFIGPEGLRLLAPALTKLQGLRVIDLRGNDLRAVGIRHLCCALPSATALQLLDLSCNGLGSTAAGMLATALTRAPNLHGITLARNPLLDDGVHLLAGKLLSHGNDVLQVLSPPVFSTDYKDSIATMLLPS